jgi:hypothetical protein
VSPGSGEPFRSIRIAGETPQNAANRKTERERERECERAAGGKRDGGKEIGYIGLRPDRIARKKKRCSWW